MKTIICAIVKNEQRFIREWVEWNIDQGFDKIYIYEDYGSDSHKEQLQDYIDKGLVELNNLSETHFVPQLKKGTLVQQALYRKFFQLCKSKEIEADWVGFFDVDEFIMFDDGWDLNKLEEEFKDEPGILLAWKLYGANGHIKRPEGNVVDNYTTHMPEGTILDSNVYNWAVKSLVNIAKCDGMKNIHEFNGCVFTNHCKPIHKLCFDKAWINHYYSKSWEDYLDRIFARGNMQNNFRSLDQFFKVNPDMIDQEEKLVMEQRERLTASTMWISRKYKIISGGNKKKLESLRKQLFNI